jgi:hypothetical protein
MAHINSMHHVIVVTFCVNYLLGVKIIHLVDRTDLFKINLLVLVGKAIVTGLYSSLEGQRQTEKQVGRVLGFIRVETRGNSVTYMTANRNNVFKI